MVEMRQMPVPTTLAPELAPDYIRPRDYIRPVLGGATLACGYAAAFAAFRAVVSSGAHSVAPAELLYFVPFCALTVLTSAVIHHRVWLYRLRKYGVQAFEVYHDLDMPVEEAFELCLASSAQLRDSKIEKCDDANNAVTVRVKGNFWITVDG